MPDAAPAHARIACLAHWATCFHPSAGVFRLPSPHGHAVRHLDIDLRFVADPPVPHPAAHPAAHPPTRPDLFLPSVHTLTLRGGEYVQDDDTRMDALAEVLLAITPREVRWLNATDDPNEQLTFATHLVHPAIIAAGEHWSRVGSLRKLVIQGGFPVPNLTAPTPFALTPAATPGTTPAATPCPSPGPTRLAFGGLALSALSALPALSTTKPKPLDEERGRARDERRRQADYSLKPRFEYAFGGWAVEELHWRLDGRYTPACITSILTHLLKAIDRSYPSSTPHADIPLPSLLAFAPLPATLLPHLPALPAHLALGQDTREYLADVAFAAGARVFAAAGGQDEAGTGGEREVRRTVAEMLLLQAQEAQDAPDGGDGGDGGRMRGAGDQGECRQLQQGGEVLRGLDSLDALTSSHTPTRACVIPFRVGRRKQTQTHGRGDGYESGTCMH